MMTGSHRYMSAERTAGYSDAVYAIVITILIVPISDAVADYEDTKSVLENLQEQALSIGIYALAVIFIYAEWEEHVWTFQTIERVTDTLLLCNIIILLPITFLPYTITVLTEHLYDPFAIFLFSVCVFITSAMELFVTLLGYRIPKISSENTGEYATTTYLRGVLIFKDCLKIILSGAAAAFAVLSVYVSWVLLILLVFHDWIAGLAIGVYNTIRPIYRYNQFGKYVWHHLFEMKFEKNRVIVLTDAVFSIVATLIVLDLSATSVPSDETLKENDMTLRDALSENLHEYLCYLSSFVTVGMIWLNHHTVFHFVTVVTRSMQACNKYSLMFVGLFPFCFKLTAVYADDRDDRDENIVVQFFCIVLFCASSFQLILYILARRHSSKHLDDSCRGLPHVFIILKLLLYPLTSLIVFCICFKSTPVNADIINGIFASFIVVYALLKVIIEIVHRHYKRRSSGDTEIDNDKEEDTKEIYRNQNTDVNSVPLDDVIMSQTNHHTSTETLETAKDM